MPGCPRLVQGPASVEEVAAVSTGNPIAPGIDPNHMVKVLKSIPGYAPLFAAAFRGETQPVTGQNVGKAIGAFERRLVTPSRFDKFLEGETSALSPIEQAGLATFMDTGCPTCHTGAALGKMLYKLGVVHPYPTEDLGRALVTGHAADRYFFKVVSLRNVSETVPYFFLHDGKVRTLDEAVRLMAHDQLGKELSERKPYGSPPNRLHPRASAPPEPNAGAEARGELSPRESTQGRDARGGNAVLFSGNLFPRRVLAKSGLRGDGLRQKQENPDP